MTNEQELLQALKALLWQHDNNGGVLCGMALQDARAAVAKAEDRSAWDGSPLIKETIQGEKWAAR